MLARVSALVGIAAMVTLLSLAALHFSSSKAGAEVVAVRDHSPKCKSARKAVAHYRQVTWAWQEQRFDIGKARRSPVVKGKSCHWAAYAAEVWRERAQASRKSFERWHSYHYDWEKWLPERWVAIFHCETPTEGQYINWAHNSGTYQGGPGFAVSTWDSFKWRAARKAGPYPEEAYQATPRQQYEVALAVARYFNWNLAGSWGCA